MGSTFQHPQAQIYKTFVLIYMAGLWEKDDPSMSQIINNSLLNLDATRSRYSLIFYCFILQFMRDCFGTVMTLSGLLIPPFMGASSSMLNFWTWRYAHWMWVSLRVPQPRTFLNCKISWFANAKLIFPLICHLCNSIQRNKHIKTLTPKWLVLKLRVRKPAQSGQAMGWCNP